MEKPSTTSTRWTARILSPGPHPRTWLMLRELKYSDPGGLSPEDVGPLGPLSWDEIGGLELRSVFCPALPLFSAMRAFWGPTNRNDLRDYLDWLRNQISDWIKSLMEALYEALWNDDTFYGNILLSALMDLLEAVVNTLGDVLGIDGAFICIDGMAQLLFGVDLGICYMYHPDLGWGMYTYKGWSGEMRMGFGISIVVGFFKWHGDPEDFTFDSWLGEFMATEVSLLVGGGFKFHNEDSSITGYGLNIGAGCVFGLSGVRTTYKRAPDWMIHGFLRDRVVPQGGG
jgi:hypothetical protein